MKDGHLDLTDVRRISEADFIEWTKKLKPRAHDVIVVRRCNSGDSALIPPDLECAIGQNLVVLRSESGVVHPKFLRWLVRGPEWWDQVGKYINVGAVFDSLRCRDIPNFELTVPPPADQAEIAGVLDALDDRIALLREATATLEAIAQALFKSWFVDFDPVRAKSQGLVPAGMDEATAALFPDGFEESAQQVALRAKRLALDVHAVDLFAEIQLERIQSVLAERKPAIAVIDSIQTIYSEVLQSAPGSVAQVRECAAQLTRLAKSSGTCMILVGHVTKEGALAGPRVLEHMVDTVLYFEGEMHSSFRMVRAFKNRFGAVNELGVFAMGEKGLREVKNPSALFLSHHDSQVPGSCILVTQEGTRPLLVEIQALVDEARSPNPRRLCVGLEQNRLAMLLAVLHRHAGIPCYDQDVFINAVGGVKITEPGADLAILLAVVSSLKNKPMAEKTIVVGEVGLAVHLDEALTAHGRRA